MNLNSSEGFYAISIKYYIHTSQESLPNSAKTIQNPSVFTTLNLSKSHSLNYILGDILKRICGFAQNQPFTTSCDAVTELKNNLNLGGKCEKVVYKHLYTTFNSLKRDRVFKQQDDHHFHLRQDDTTRDEIRPGCGQIPNS
jgi:hypothetical protein